jgi:hypothetical protein
MRIAIASAPNPIAIGKSVLVTIGAEKSDTTMPKVFILACNKIAMNILPLVWLKTQVIITVMDMTSTKKIGKFI